MTPPEHGQFGPQGLDWLHTKYVSCWPHGFRDEDVFSFSHTKSVSSGPLVSEKKIFEGFLAIRFYIKV